MSDKMREVPPITDETYKALMVALGMPNNRSLLSALQQIANHATQRAAWQAAKSAPVVGEVVAWAVPNSRPTELSPFMQVMLQIPSAAQYPELLVPLIVQPTHSITEAELERLRKDAERLDWLNKNVTRVSDSERYLPRHVYWGNGTKHNVRTAIDAAIAAEGGK